MAKKDAPKSSKKRTIGKIIGRGCAIIFSTIFMLFLILYGSMWIFCHGPSTAARDLFVSTMMETGALKFLTKWYFSKEEILEITNKNSMGKLEGDVDTSLIQIDPDKNTDEDDDDDDTELGYEDNFDENGIEIFTVTGRTYMGKVMIVKDPSKVSVGTIYPWSSFSKEKYGSTLDNLVKDNGAIAGVNGGEYCSDGNWGGRPKGLVVSNGDIQFNEPQSGDVMVGFNKDNILVIKEIGDMSAAQVEDYVRKNNIRDAVSFKDVVGQDDNHFTKLILNNQPVPLNGAGSGANPRTVIGQRKDGAVILFVTDGRGHESHLGATAADLIGVLQEYGAVNAANIDGGSSSSMYYNGKYEMTSVTLYYSTSSWRLPTGFVVK